MFLACNDALLDSAIMEHGHALKMHTRDAIKLATVATKGSSGAKRER